MKVRGWRGFTFLEVALAMVVLLIGMAGIVGFSNALLRGFYQGQLALQADPQVAERLMQDQVEAIRSWDGQSGAPPMAPPLPIGAGQAFGLTVVEAGGGPVAFTGGYGSPVTQWQGLCIQVTYKGGLQAFQDPGTDLTQKRSYAQAIAIGPYGYEFGGEHVSGTSTNDAVRIGFDAAGKVAAASIVDPIAQHLVAAAEQLAPIVVGPYVYLIGGVVLPGNTALTTVQRCSIASDGTLTGAGFTTAGVPQLATARVWPLVVQVGSTLYVIGGTGQTSVEAATVNPDGSLGPFAPSATSLVTTHDYAAAFVYGKRCYVVGGNGRTSVEAAPITGGVLGAFAVVPGVALNSARGEYASFVVGSRFYVLQGWNGAIVGSAESAPLNPDGTLGPFTYDLGSSATVAVPGISPGLNDLAALVTRGYVLTLGGATGANAPVLTTYQAQLTGIVGQSIVDKQGKAAASGYGL